MALSTLLAKKHTMKDYRFRPLTEAIIIGLSILLVILSVSYFIYSHALDAQKGEIREGLLRTAVTISSIIDGDIHNRFKHPDQEHEESYLNFIKPLEKILSLDESIVFIYTTVMIDDKVYFVVDPTPEGDADGDGIDDKSHIMELYKNADSALRKALKEQVAMATDEPYVDKWGSFMSAYAPFYTRDGDFAGVVGIDITANNYFTRLKPMLRSTVRAMVAGCFVSFVVAALVWFMRNFAKIINARRKTVVQDFAALQHSLEEKK